MDSGAGSGVGSTTGAGRNGAGNTTQTGRGSEFDALLSAETQPMTSTPTRPIRFEVASITDRLWNRLASTPARARAVRWSGPILVTLLAAGTRLWNLGHPESLVFDETFYVKDAYTLLSLGYEAQWPAEADASFNAGNTDIHHDTASFVVHPPLGKWLIALGFIAFGGAGDTASWRIGTAVVGILAVILVMAIAKLLFKSTLVATIAGTLMAIDGNAIVMSRVALLDNFLMFFALLGFGAVLLDREHSARRLERWIAQRQSAGRSIDWGPALWWRPWLLAAGVAFGLAAAVKWNGLYFLAALAVYTVLVDAAARRRAGVPLWFSGTIFTQAPVSFLLTVPTALGAYLVTWTGWLATSGGYHRQFAAQEGNAWEGLLSWVPLSLQSLWHFHVDIYNYHLGENSEHPYSANPLLWLLLVRPTSMYFLGSNLGENGCTVDFCGQSITGIANPIIWWAGVAAALYLVYRLVRFREWRAGLILTGLAAGYLPWLLYLNRTVYQFYTIAFEPYLILAIAFVAWRMLGERGDPAWLRDRGSRTVAVFLGVALLVSVFFWPLWTGIQVDWDFIRAHYWLESWR